MIAASLYEEGKLLSPQFWLDEGPWLIGATIWSIGECRRWADAAFFAT